MFALGPEKGLDFGASAPAQPPGRDAAAGERDERVEEWLRLCGVIREDGSFDQAQALRELHDYFFVLGEAGKVYDHITGGRISQQNTYAFEVIAAADDLAIEETNEAVQEALAAGAAAQAEREHERGYRDAIADVHRHILNAEDAMGADTLYRVDVYSKLQRLLHALEPHAPCRLCAEAGPHAHAVGECE